MIKLSVTLLSGLLFSASILAESELNRHANQSFFNAVLDVNAINTQANSQHVNSESRKLNTHESQRANSLVHAVLARQKVNYNLQLNSHTQVSLSRDKATSEKQKNNSLFHGALSK